MTKGSWQTSLDRHFWTTWPPDLAPLGAQLRSNSEGVADEYEACPDTDVFDWNESRLKAVESYQEKERTRYFPMGPLQTVYAEDVQTKKVLASSRRVQEYLVHVDKKAASLLRDVSLREVRRAVSARINNDRRTRRWSTSGCSFTFFIPMLGATVVSLWANSHRGWWLFLLGPTEFMIVTVLSLGLVTSKLWLRSIFIVMLSWSAVAIFIVGLYYHDRSPGLLLESSAGVAVSGLIGFAVLLLAGWVTSLVEFRGQGTTAEALLLIDMISLITTAMEWEIADEKQQELIRKLEDAATLAEQTFPYAARRSGKQFRRWGTDRAHRVAAVIRKHEERVLEVPVEQRRVITVSLTNGLVYLMRGDWDSFLVVEPEGIKSVVRRYAPRAALAALFVLVAFLIPQLWPHAIKDSLSFEVTFLVTAGFTLISPDAQKTVENIRSVIGPS